MKKHWTEQFSCICGKRFSSYSKEAYHRHNFPILCNKTGLKKWQAKEVMEKDEGDD